MIILILFFCFLLCFRIVCLRKRQEVLGLQRLLNLSFTSEQSDKQEQQNMTGCLLRFIYPNKGFFVNWETEHFCQNVTLVC